MSRCLCASRACPTHALDVLSPSHIACVMACNNTNNACQKPKAGKAWPLADGAQIWVDSGSTARATHQSLRLPDTFCSICDRAIRLRAQLPTTLHHHHQPFAARVCTVPLIRPPLTSPAPACGLARPCTLRLTCAISTNSPVKHIGAVSGVHHAQAPRYCLVVLPPVR